MLPCNVQYRLVIRNSPVVAMLENPCNMRFYRLQTDSKPPRQPRRPVTTGRIRPFLTKDSSLRLALARGSSEEISRMRPWAMLYQTAGPGQIEIFIPQMYSAAKHPADPVRILTVADNGLTVTVLWSRAQWSSTPGTGISFPAVPTAMIPVSLNTAPHARRSQDCQVTDGWKRPTIATG